MADMKKPTVCVTLEGVLAYSDGWGGPGNIGAPIPGAVELVKTLSEFANVAVFTWYCNPNLQPGYSDMELVAIVTDWLNEHGFPPVEVSFEVGKPIAAAYIGERVVPCQPQRLKAGFEHRAFDAAVASAKRMCGEIGKEV